MLKIYLAGAIRDGNLDDVIWRERMIDELGKQADFLNPLGGKEYDPSTKKWTASGVPPISRFIVKHDFWCVDNSDIIIFNFRALSEKYPNIGTLVEFGRATGTGCLIYSIIDPAYQGHDNLGMFKLHPFLEENSAAVFATVDDCIKFLSSHLEVLSGRDSHMRGVNRKGFLVSS